ncbi:MAG: DUF4411 family protein [Gemmatimonadota bacterium]|nr:DUF4411 family protein [Gemmatimonadota bacterium]
MKAARIYLVDSDDFITAKNLYYSFDICPGFWRSVVHHHQAGRVFSIDRVRGELLAGPFATGADGWLVAYARVHGATVVTNEQSAPESRKEIKLPDVCDRFGVLRANTFAMLRALHVQFDWGRAG